MKNLSVFDFKIHNFGKYLTDLADVRVFEKINLSTNYAEVWSALENDI